MSVSIRRCPHCKTPAEIAVDMPQSPWKKAKLDYYDCSKCGQRTLWESLLYNRKLTFFGGSVAGMGDLEWSFGLTFSDVAPGTLARLDWEEPSNVVEADIRYVAGSTFSAAQWDSATQMTNEPVSSGGTQSWIIATNGSQDGIQPGTTYAWAMKCNLLDGRKTTMSNVATGNTG